VSDIIDNNAVESQPDNQDVYEEESMILPALTSLMSVDFVLNGDGSVWILHDKPFSHYLKWVEYDAAHNHIAIIMQEGKIQPLGLVIPDSMMPKLIQAEKICVTQLRNKKVWDVYILPFLVTEAAIN